MTFKAHLGKVNLFLILALLAALLAPVLGVATVQALASHENFDAGTAENAHPGNRPVTSIASGCGEPGGNGGSC